MSNQILRKIDAKIGIFLSVHMSYDSKSMRACGIAEIKIRRPMSDNVDFYRTISNQITESLESLKNV